MSYSATFLDCFSNTTCAGVCEKGTVRQVELGDATQFTRFKLSVSIKDKKILEARFQASTTPELIAAGEYLCRWLKGRSLDSLDTLSEAQILDALGLDSLYIYIAGIIVRSVRQIALS